ncbi:unnamed protein product [Rotaria sp. Silwood2]|nr:unnamed protein product [Rotaria sp. Silwood2]CAF2537331.1 unnamed protein product [Rotaria sp. Silwood2]CAF2934556.1 unnamed protein product [Rotaria sp. Silwood2]CAF4116515.1 unnamed protein product [Rotaria sp. Silwood2]CAF4177952.1 unnamed protein product [Rotaria sp. Silwood2]
MFDNDVSYLYLNDFLTLSSSNEKELGTKVSHSVEYRPIRTRICRIPTETLETGHRTKHIILFREGAVKCDKQCRRKQLGVQQLKEKNKLFEDNLRKQVQGLIDEQSHLENHLTKLQSPTTDFKTVINNNVCTDSFTNLFLTDKEKTSLLFNQYSHEYDPFSLSITNLLHFDHNTEDNFDT